MKPEELRPGLIDNRHSPFLKNVSGCVLRACRYPLDQILDFHPAPTFRDQAEGGGDQLDLLVAGEAEVGEPLAVDRLRHFLQDLDPPRIAIDQVVVSRESCSNSLLDWKGRQYYWKAWEPNQWDAVYRGPENRIL
jgi:hypothetical protein